MKAQEIRPLVVDDEDQLRMTVALMLRAAFKISADNITEACNGADAIEQLAAARPNVIVTDTDMPEMNGIEMIKAIRARPDFKDVVIVMTSGYDRSDIATQIGANVFIQKPYTSAVLRQTITELLNIEADAPAANAPTAPDQPPTPPQNGDQPGEDRGGFPHYPLAR
jgi:two-component system chemotaxis response regulator CheY